MKRSILLFVLISNFIISAFGQPGHHFFGENGDDGFTQITETSDGNLLLLGTKTLNSIPKIWLQKITKDGQLIWEKNFSSKGLLSETAYGIRLKVEEDGNILILGNGRFRTGTEFIKTTPNGELIWQQSYDDFLYDFAKKGDKYFLVGKRPVANNTKLGYLLSTNQIGEQISSTTYNFDERNDTKRIFAFKNSDKLLVFGRLDRTGLSGSYIFSAKMDRLLNLTNRKNTESDNEHYLSGSFNSLSPLPLSSYQAPNDDIWVTFQNEGLLLLKFDSTGTEKARYEISAGETLQPFSLKPIKDGNMLITGFVGSFLPYKAFAAKVSNQGNIIWIKYYEPKKENIIISSVETLCGRIFLAGATKQGSDYDGMLIEINQTGESSSRNILIDTTVCIENPITIRGQVLDQTGTYDFRFPDVNNPDSQCDTTINLNLTIADIHAPKIECFHDTFIGGFAIEWETVPLVDGYKIFINGDSVTTQTHKSYLHILNSPDETIQFEVVPFNSTGCRFYSSIAECSATSDASNITRFKSQISVIPNPSTGVFQFQTNLKIEQIEVLDSFGKLLFKSKDSSIDLSEQVSGLYFFKIKTSEGTVLKKGVKI